MNFMSRRYTVFASMALAVLATSTIAAQDRPDKPGASDAPITIEVSNDHGPSQRVVVSSDSAPAAFSVDLMHDGTVVSHAVINTLDVAGLPAVLQVMSQHPYVDSVSTTESPEAGTNSKKRWTSYTTGLTVSIMRTAKPDLYRVHLHVSDTDGGESPKSGRQRPMLREMERLSVERLALGKAVTFASDDGHEALALKRVL